MCYDAPWEWLDFSDNIPSPLVLWEISYFLDKNIAYNFKTNGQFLMHFYVVM